MKKFVSRCYSAVKHKAGKVLGICAAAGAAVMSSQPVRAAIDLSTTEFETATAEAWFVKVLGVVMLLVMLGVIISLTKRAR